MHRERLGSHVSSCCTPGVLERRLPLSNAQRPRHNKLGSDVNSWNAAIWGYVKNGRSLEALACFEQMQEGGISPNAFTFAYLLKASAQIGSIDFGVKLHDHIVSSGLLQENLVLGNALVDMYVKFGLLRKADQVHDQLCIRDVVSWSALIAGYAKCGQGHDALDCFERMRCEGISANAITFSCLLKACGNLGAVAKGKELHGEIGKRNLLGKDTVLATSLVDMYVKCGMLATAHQVHDELCGRDLISWNALIGGYAQHGEGREALNCFKIMQREGICPNEVTFLHIVKACGSIGAIDQGDQVHAQIINGDVLEKDMLASALVDMYTKCGMLKKAQHLHESLRIQSVASWNVLIAGYVKQRKGNEALTCFSQMKGKDISPNAITYVEILKACGITGAVEKGKQIHEEIVHKDLLEKDIVLGTALVDMYAKCGKLMKAQQVHDELLVRDVVSWNTLIAGYVQHKKHREALSCCEMMRKQGIRPNAVTFACILKSCSNAGDIDTGKQIHKEIASLGLLEKNIVLGNALVDMYAKCGLLAKSEEVLESLPGRDVISWSALIAGYAQQGKGSEALDCFQQMQIEGLSPDMVTLTCILNACGNIQAIDKGEQIHDQIISKGISNENIVLGTALIDMYAKCGVLKKAQEILEGLPGRNVISWSALISGFTQQEEAHEALCCLEQMQTEGLPPDPITLTSILKVCGLIGAIDQGERIHNEILSRKLLEKDIVLGTALVDMYTRCGALTRAQQVIEDLPARDIVTWNVLIAGYAQQGQGCKALSCFEWIQGEGLSPDAITFLCVLNACSHSGLLNVAQSYFTSMSSRSHRIRLEMEHHVCMVVIYGCAGHFDKALSMIKAMPASNAPSVWLALLRACRTWGNVEVGKLAFDQAVKLQTDSAAAYVLMASIYAACGMHEDAEKLLSSKVCSYC